jgi:hypothetical protein
MEGLAAGGFRARQKDGVHAGEAGGVEGAGDGRFVAHDGEGAHALLVGGDEAKVDGGFGGCGHVANLPAERRFAAH